MASCLGMLAFGATQASAYTDGPSSDDPSRLVVLPSAVGSLDELPVFSSTDVAIAGIPDTEVGIDAAAADVMAAAPANSLVVDDDMVQCKNATFTTINQAVAAALPGDTIKVCPGDYQETVLVTKTLTFRGSTKTSDSRCIKRTEVPDANKDTILHYPFSGTSEGGGSPGFNVQANNVVIAGFFIEPDLFDGTPTGPTQNGDGIYSWPTTTGIVVRDNVLQNNSRGARLHNTGTTQAVVKKTCVRNNNLGNFFLTTTGLGIDLRGPAADNFLVDHNYSTINDTAAINLDGATNSTIRHNKSFEDSSAVGLFDTMSILVQHNKASDSFGTAIYMGADNSNDRLVSNHVKNGGALQDDSGIAFTNLSPIGLPGGPNTLLEVRDNQIEHMAGSGLRAAMGTSLTNSTLAKNHAHDNGVDGIRIEGGGNGMNTITQNKLKKNDEHDCHDDTVGAGTGGTANTWTKNEGDTQNRPGLCKHAQTT